MARRRGLFLALLAMTPSLRAQEHGSVERDATRPVPEFRCADLEKYVRQKQILKKRLKGPQLGSPILKGLIHGKLGDQANTGRVTRSPDGKFEFFTVVRQLDMGHGATMQAWEPQLKDVETGKDRVLSKPGVIYSEIFLTNDDLRFLIRRDSDVYAVSHSLRTHVSSQQKLPWSQASDWTLTPMGGRLVHREADPEPPAQTDEYGNQIYQPRETFTITEFDGTSYAKVAGVRAGDLKVLGDGKLAFRDSRGKTDEILDTQTGKVLFTSQSLAPPAISPDKNWLAFAPNFSEVVLQSLSSADRIVISKQLLTRDMSAWLPDGRFVWMEIERPPGEAKTKPIGYVKIVDPATRKVQTLGPFPDADWAHSVQVLGNQGLQITTGSLNKVHQYYASASGNSKPVEFSSRYLGSGFGDWSARGDTYTFDREYDARKTLYGMRTFEEEMDPRALEYATCPLEPAAFRKLLKKNTFNFDNFFIYCGEGPHGAHAEELKFIDEAMEKRGVADPFALQWFATRLQNPLFFDPYNSVHMNFLSVLLESEAFRTKAPDAVLNLLASLFQVDQNVYERVIALNPQLRDLPGAGVTSRCRSAETERALQKRIGSYLSMNFWSLTHAQESSAPGYFDRLKVPLKVMAPGDSVHEDTYRDATNALEGYYTRGPLNGHAPTQIRLFVEGSLKKYFKPDQYHPISLLTWQQSQTSVRPVLLSTEPVESKATPRDVPSLFNIYDFPTVNLPKDFASFPKGHKTPEQRYEWTRQGRTMSSGLRLVKTSQRTEEAKTKGPSPNVWGDHKLVGAVVAGSNLAGDETDLLDRYKGYYKEQLFKFDEPARIRPAHEVLRELVASGELDYLVKESHSGGMDDDLVDVAASFKVVKGTKNIPGTPPREEHVYLLYPIGAAATTIKVADLQSWFLERERKAANAPMTYFNTSCGSMYNSAKAYAGVGSKNFVPIGSESICIYFRNNPENSALYQLLHSYRNGASWEQIRKNMGAATAADVARGNPAAANQNFFRLPDENRYWDWMKKFDAFFVESVD